MSCLLCLNNSSVNPALQQNSSVEGFLFTLAIIVPVFIVLVTIWIFVRNNSPYFIFKQDDSLPKGYVSWIIPLLKTTDSELLRKAGLDVVMFLNVLKLGLIFFFLASLFGVAIIVPVNYTGRNNQTGFEQFSFSNIQTQSPSAWCHVAFTYFFSIGCIGFLVYFYKKYLALRCEYLQNFPQLNQHSVLIRNLPDDLRDEIKLRNFLEKIYGPQIEAVFMIAQDRFLTLLVKYRRKLFRKLERLVIISKTDSDAPIQYHRLGLFGKKVESIPYYKDRIQKVDKMIERELNKEKPLAPTAIVMFKSLVATNIALQTIHFQNWELFSTRRAPEPRDIKWSNVSVPLPYRIQGKILTYIALLIIMLFWSVPIIFFASLTTMENLIKILPFLDFINSSPALKGFLDGFLPTLFLKIFIALIPMILRWVVSNEYLPTYSSIEKQVMSKLFLFLFVNVFLVVTISGTIFSTLEAIFFNPTTILDTLATTLPQVSVFFMQYVLFSTFISQPLELLRFGGPIFQYIRIRWFVKTEHEREQTMHPGYPAYDINYAYVLLTFTIGLTYSTISPLILPIITAYFAVSYFVWIHQVTYVYPIKYESEGKLWILAHNRILVGLFVFQLTVIGVVLLNDSVIESILTVPLIFITAFYTWYSRQKYQTRATIFSQDMIIALSDEKERELAFDPNYYLNPAQQLPQLQASSTHLDKKLDQSTTQMTDGENLNESDVENEVEKEIDKEMDIEMV